MGKRDGCIKEISEIQKLEEEKTNEYYKNNSPYKSTYEIDDSIIDVAMIFNGGSIVFSAPEKIVGLGEVGASGIKISGVFDATIDASKMSNLSKDGGTLQEVTTKLYERFTHRGGISQIKK